MPSLSIKCLTLPVTGPGQTQPTRPRTYAISQRLDEPSGGILQYTHAAVAVKICTLEVPASVSHIKPIENMAVKPAMYPSFCSVPLAVVNTPMARVGSKQATTVATAEVNLSIFISEYVSSLLYPEEELALSVNISSNIGKRAYLAHVTVIALPLLPSVPPVVIEGNPLISHPARKAVYFLTRLGRDEVEICPGAFL